MPRIRIVPSLKSIKRDWTHFLRLLIVDHNPDVDGGGQPKPDHVGDEKPARDPINATVEKHHRNDQSIEKNNVDEGPSGLVEGKEEERPEDVQDQLEAVGPQGETGHGTLPCDTPSGEGQQRKEERPDRREEPAGGLERRFKELIVPGAEAQRSQPASKPQGQK